MNKLLLILPAVAAGLLFTGCADDPHYRRVAYADGPAYSGDVYDSPGYYGGGDEVDFYYEGGRPYSRNYGPLVYRDNRYYYSRGGAYVTYDRGSRYGGRDSVRSYDRHAYAHAGYDRGNYNGNQATVTTRDRRNYQVGNSQVTSRGQAYNVQRNPAVGTQRVTVSRGQGGVQRTDVRVEGKKHDHEGD